MCARLRNRIAIGLGVAAVWLAAGPVQAAVPGGTTPTDGLTPPAPAYAASDRRDPFVRPGQTRLSPAAAHVDIAELALTGIIRNPQRAMALFTSRSGPQFGYLLKDGRLFGENQQPVPGVTGTVRSSKEVVLQQDGRELMFRLPG